MGIAVEERESNGNRKRATVWTSCPFCDLPKEEWEYGTFQGHYRNNCPGNN